MAIGAAFVGKTILSFLLRPRNIAIILMLAAIAFGLYQAYDWAYDRGVEAQKKVDAPKIAKLEGEVTDLKVKLKAEKDRRQLAEKKLKEYVAEYKHWVETTDKANRELIASQKQTIDKLSRDLRVARANAIKKEELLNEISKYVTTGDDAACVIPVGFVELFNKSLEAEQSPRQRRVSRSTAGAAGEPSGITLSQLADVVVRNNAEAVQRGVIVQKWNEWYDRSKENFDRAIQRSREAVPTAETDSVLNPQTMRLEHSVLPTTSEEAIIEVIDVEEQAANDERYMCRIAHNDSWLDSTLNCHSYSMMEKDRAVALLYEEIRGISLAK